MGFDQQFARSQGALHKQSGDVVRYVPAGDGRGDDSNAKTIDNAILAGEVEVEREGDYGPAGLRWVKTRALSFVTDRNAEGFSGVELVDDAATVEVETPDGLLLTYSIETIARTSGGCAELGLIFEGQKTINRRGAIK